MASIVGLTHKIMQYLIIHIERIIWNDIISQLCYVWILHEIYSLVGFKSSAYLVNKQIYKSSVWQSNQSASL